VSAPASVAEPEPAAAPAAPVAADEDGEDEEGGETTDKKVGYPSKAVVAFLTYSLAEEEEEEEG
jgi:hypothetical protein